MTERGRLKPVWNFAIIVIHLLLDVRLILPSPFRKEVSYVVANGSVVSDAETFFETFRVGTKLFDAPVLLQFCRKYVISTIHFILIAFAWVLLLATIEQTSSKTRGIGT